MQNMKDTYWKTYKNEIITRKLDSAIVTQDMQDRLENMIVEDLQYNIAPDHCLTTYCIRTTRPKNIKNVELHFKHPTKWTAEEKEDFRGIFAIQRMQTTSKWKDIQRAIEIGAPMELYTRETHHDKQDWHKPEQRLNKKIQQLLKWRKEPKFRTTKQLKHWRKLIRKTKRKLKRATERRQQKEFKKWLREFQQRHKTNPQQFF
jgi:hypothetical protein